MFTKSILKFGLSAVLALTAMSQTDASDLQNRRPLTPKQKERLQTKLQALKTTPKSAKAKEALMAPDPALGGWWQMVTRGSQGGFGFGALTNDIDSYIYIDLDQYDPENFPYVIINTLCGTPTYPRECTIRDVAGGAIEYNIYYLPSATELVNVVAFGGPLFDPAFYQSLWSLSLQADGQTLAASSASQPSDQGYNPPGVSLFRKVDGPQMPVRPYNDADSGFTDVNNPVEIAKYIRNSLLLNHNDPQNINFNDGEYLNFFDAEAIFQKMLNEGITYETKIHNIRVSQPGTHFSAEFLNYTSDDRLTDIFTDGYSFATVGSTVEISGFEGKWKKLNGKYVNGVAITEVDGILSPSPLHVDVSSSTTPKKGTFRNVYNHFMLDFDSSNKKEFPRTKDGWAKDIEGCPTVKVTHRFTPDMEYPEFVAAIRAMFFAIYKVSQHNSHRGFFYPGSMFLIDTWDELKTAVATNNFWESPVYPGIRNLRTRTTQALGSSFYNNAVLARRLVTTYNDPFGITQDPESKYNYNIVLGNYVTAAKNVYWAIKGTPTGPTQFDPVDVGYKPAIPGNHPAEFVGVLGDIVVVDGIPQPQNPDTTHYSLLTPQFDTQPQSDTYDSNSYYVGLIDPSLTKGKRVGYLRFIDELAADPLSYLSTSTFHPDVPLTVKFAREAACKVYSNFTKYLQTDLDCDAVILDVRGNNGGTFWVGYTLAEFFGDDRAAYTRLFSKKDDGNSSLIDLTDSSSYSFYNNNAELISDSFAHFYVQQNEANYGPGAVFKGSAERPKKVIVLTDNGAASGGDVFPHLFLGEHLDGNLGSYTTCKIIGDIDGRLKGAASAYMPVPVSASSSFLKTPGGNPVSPINFRADSAFGVLINGLTETFYNQQLPEIAPSFAPSLTGTAGGAPLPNDWNNTVWPDLGFTKPPKGHFSKKIHKAKPRKNKRCTWRDSWLEQAILAAVEE